MLAGLQQGAWLPVCSSPVRPLPQRLTQSLWPQAETFTPEDAQTLALPDDAAKARLLDPLHRLEHSENDKAVARSEAVCPAECCALSVTDRQKTLWLWQAWSCCIGCKDLCSSLLSHGACGHAPEQLPCCSTGAHEPPARNQQRALQGRLHSQQGPAAPLEVRPITWPHAQACMSAACCCLAPMSLLLGRQMAACTCTDARCLMPSVRPRAVRKDDKARDQQREALGLSEDVKLLPAAPEDAAVAALTVFGAPHAHLKNWRKLRHSISTQSIFPAAAAPPGRLSGPGLARGVKRKSIAELAAGQVKQQRLQ